MKICISSSCRFAEEWNPLKKNLEQTGATVYVPEVQELEGLAQSDVDRVMETTNREFFEQIDSCDILYVYCPKGYIGRGVGTEIGYAIARGKQVIASDQIEDLGVWSIVNRVVPPADFIKDIREVKDV